MAEALHDITAYCADSASFQIRGVAFDVVQVDSTSEDGASCGLDSQVSQAGTQQLVGGVDPHQTVIDEEVAAHNFVDGELLDECKGGVGGKRICLIFFARLLVGLDEGVGNLWAT